MIRSLTSMFAATLAALVILNFAAPAFAQQGGADDPAFRAARNENHGGTAAHPLDPALEVARNGLTNIRENLQDYTCTMVKRERIDGTLNDQEFMYVKVRCRKVKDGRVVTPLSIYMKFLKPEQIAGREVIWVEGQNEGKLFAHEVPGIRNVVTVRLDPTAKFAMEGQRYPITEAGVENLIVKLLEKGHRDRQRGEVDVKFYKQAKINGRVCTLLEVTHPTERPYFDFHIARVFIDDDLQLPVRYAAWTWPAKSGGKPVLEEEYTYVNMKTNVGLADIDFDYRNPKYQFPARVFPPFGG